MMPLYILGGAVVSAVGTKEFRQAAGKSEFGL